MGETKGESAGAAVSSWGSSWGRPGPWYVLSAVVIVFVVIDLAATPYFVGPSTIFECGTGFEILLGDASAECASENRATVLLRLLVGLAIAAGFAGVGIYFGSPRPGRPRTARVSELRPGDRLQGLAGAVEVQSVSWLASGRVHIEYRGGHTEELRGSQEVKVLPPDLRSPS